MAARSKNDHLNQKLHLVHKVFQNMPTMWHLNERNQATLVVYMGTCTILTVWLHIVHILFTQCDM